MAQSRGALIAWLFGLIICLSALIGFVVTIDASGTFGNNDHGLYAGDELFIKSSLMRHRPHNALLLGDSRAAYTDPASVGGLRFFNAAAGGANLADAWALLRRHDLEGVRLVVVMLPVGDLVGGCDQKSRLDDPWRLLRRGASLDAIIDSAIYLHRRWQGALPDHRADGTRFPDGRTIVPFGWDGTQAKRYRDRLDAVRGDTPLEQALAEAEPCLAVLEAMRAHVRAAGAEILVVIAPLNRDLLQASGSDPVAVSRVIAARLLAKIPYAVDFTATQFSDPANFPPRDAVHFHPEIGGAVLQAAIAQACLDGVACPR